MRAMLIVTVLATVHCQNQSVDQPGPGATLITAERVDGFPLPVPTGSDVREVRNATTVEKPRHQADAELEARVPGDVNAIAAFYSGQLAARGLEVQATEHARVDDRKPEAPQKKLIRIVGKKDQTQVHVIITPGRSAHKLQIALVGAL